MQSPRKRSFAAEELARRKRSSTRTTLLIALSENDNGFVWLEKAFEERVSWLPFEMNSIKYLPYWEPIRSDPRFKVLLKKMGLPEK